jgi:hypothetical protein
VVNVFDVVRHVIFIKDNSILEHVIHVAFEAKINVDRVVIELWRFNLLLLYVSTISSAVLLLLCRVCANDEWMDPQIDVVSYVWHAPRWY